jgi:hypothetical protein
MKLKLALLPLLLAGCTPAVKTVSVDEAVTKQVLDHHLQTFQSNDLEGVMADYTEESVLITPDRTFTGLAEIRENFVGAFQALPNPGTTMTVTKSVISKDVAYIVWTATTPTLTFKYATDTFIVQGGKIVRQTYAGDVMGVSDVEAGD